MTGRRLLDAAAIFKASRGIASKHVALRKHQLDAYSKTSSLAKAAKSQTDRVTLTVKAASVLAGRFNESGPEYSSQASKPETQGKDGSIPRENSVEGANQVGGEEQGIAQDQFYKKSEDNAAAEPPPAGNLGVKQEKANRHPLPDGLNPPAGTAMGGSKQDKASYLGLPQTEPVKHTLKNQKGSTDDILQPASSSRTSIPEPAEKISPLSADEVRRLQQHLEKQISSKAAEPPPATSSETDAEDPSLKTNQDQDVFYSPLQSIGRVLSALPPVKLPKNAEETQESDEHVSDAQMNQDVSYSTTSKDREQDIPESQAVPEDEQLPEQAYSEIIHSPRVAKMFRGQTNKDAPAKGLELSGAEDAPVKQMKASEKSDQVSSSIRIPALDRPEDSASSTNVDPMASGGKVEEDVHVLAADIAKDAESMSASTSETPKDLEARPTKAPYEMRESRVPSSRLGRFWQYGGLAASMTFGAVSESFRRATGGDGDAGGSLMLSAGNMERLVAKLSRMRGAALKLGQMMSFQDSKMLPGPINEVLQRVQDSADYMPASQRNKVLASNLGSEWRDLFSSFDEKPIAAASIGEVHSATLKSSGQRVAVKVQYPGVASSIDSDLSNLSILLTASRLLPKGLYLDKTIANARTELAWECDYLREAEMGSRFRQLLSDDTNIFHVPAFIPEASGSEVLTAEFCEGIGVTKVQNFTQEQRDWIGTHILRLCLREITEFKFMQTDPNWTNFLFNAKTNKLELLDFGASRNFPNEFIDPYIHTLLAASRSDRATVRDLSIQLGYLTGHESQAMLNAHVGSILTLAEPFMDTAPEVYDFRDQTITDRVRGFIPVMVRERLAPPPEETYSLHRKLSGAFLLCARLGSRVMCRKMFADAMRKAGVI